MLYIYYNPIYTMKWMQQIASILPYNSNAKKMSKDIWIIEENHETADRVTIQSWYSGSAYQIEEFKAADGSTLMNTQVSQLIQAMASFTTSSGMSWEQAVEDKNQDAQNLLSQFWVKQAI